MISEKRNDNIRLHGAGELGEFNFPYLAQSEEFFARAKGGN
jgi:hypothetical protein